VRVAWLSNLHLFRQSFLLLHHHCTCCRESDRYGEANEIVQLQQWRGITPFISGGPHSDGMPGVWVAVDYYQRPEA
jgi:hypothetical protein